MPNLTTDFAHLGLGATATVEPPFTGMDWYAGYGARHAADGAEGGLSRNTTSGPAGIRGKTTRTASNSSSAPPAR